jgi:hypothetical protein
MSLIETLLRHAVETCRHAVDVVHATLLHHFPLPSNTWSKNDDPIRETPEAPSFNPGDLDLGFPSEQQE